MATEFPVVVNNRGRMAAFGQVNIFRVWKTQECWHGSWQSYSQIIRESVPPCGPGLSWLTRFHWRVRLFSQDFVPLAPPTPARWARDSSWRPGRTCRATSSRSSCAWLGRRCRSARIWAVPHSPRTVLPVRQRSQRSVSAINVPGHNLWKLFFSTCRLSLFHLRCFSEHKQKFKPHVGVTRTTQP